MRRSVSTLLLLLVRSVFSCNDYEGQNTTLSYAGKAKPIVAFVPVMDHTKNDLSWSLSDEFTTEIGSRLRQEKKLHLQDIEKTYTHLKKAKIKANPFGNEIDWISQVFTEEDFVVFLEVVEHDEILKQNKQNPVAPHLCSSDLNITLRIRMFDLRQEKPQVILQELLHETQFIPAPFTYVNFYQSSWQEDAFSISPTGLTHAKLYKEAASRIRDYILL